MCASIQVNPKTLQLCALTVSHCNSRNSDCRQRKERKSRLRLAAVCSAARRAQRGSETTVTAGSEVGWPLTAGSPWQPDFSQCKSGRRKSASSSCICSARLPRLTFDLWSNAFVLHARLQQRVNAFISSYSLASRRY